MCTLYMNCVCRGNTVRAPDQIILHGLRKEGPHRGGLGLSLAPEEVETGSRTADPQAIGIESDGDAVDQYNSYY